MESTDPTLAAITRVVDEILLEHGEYTPMELLLRIGALTMADQDRWRVGDLASVLRGPLPTIHIQLAAAAEHCRALGLQPENTLPGPDVSARGSEAMEPALTHLLETAYRPRADRDQLDLFLDSRAIHAEQSLREALVFRDHDLATQRLARFKALSPEHLLAEDYERLVITLPTPATIASDAAAERLEFVRQHLEPSAQRLLGPHARSHLTPWWTALADALGGRPFDAARPELHESFVAGRAGDWERVRTALLTDPLHTEHADLVVRLLQAACILRDIPLAFDCVRILCWDHPQAAGEALATSALFSAPYRDFLKLPWTFTVEDFPVWHALARQQALPEQEAGHPQQPLIAAVNALIHGAGRDAGGATEIAARRTLKTLHPELLEWYLGER